MKYENWIPMPRFLLRKAVLKSILKTIDLENKKCLEIGFGSGEILKLLASRDLKIVGFDFSEDAVQIARERLSDFNKKDSITLIHSKDYLLSNEYDMLLALEVLEHIEDDKGALSEWLSYLKPNADLIISVPAHMSKWGESDVWAGHFRRYEKKELIEILQANNLKIEKVWNYGYPLTLVLDILLHKGKKKEVQKLNDDNSNKIDLSKKSGIERKNRFIYRLLSNDIVLFPFYFLQKLFLNSDIGSGYIVHAKKIK